VDFSHQATSIAILSHAQAARYWIKLEMSKDVSKSMGIKVKMCVAYDMSVGRHRYLRRVTLDTHLEHGDALFGDSEEEKELLDDCVDMIVSCICQLIM
jgi:uncharacterized protein YaeQ